jgi:hypothetical protein
MRAGSGGSLGSPRAPLRLDLDNTLVDPAAAFRRAARSMAIAGQAGLPR